MLGVPELAQVSSTPQRRSGHPYTAWRGVKRQGPGVRLLSDLKSLKVAGSEYSWKSGRQGVERGMVNLNLLQSLSPESEALKRQLIPTPCS